jgi:3D (Asp-Asp-Asp) domain-containing protein
MGIGTAYNSTVAPALRGEIAMRFAKVVVLAGLVCASGFGMELEMRATAYAQHGRTASGTRARRGVIAADPRVLPLGTKVKVKGAGRYSGVYRVEDTGRRIRGRKIDVFMPSGREARRFGKRPVRVKVLKKY